MLVLPVEALPYKSRGSPGEWGGPIRRIRSRIWGFLPGRVERRSGRGVEGVEGVGAGGTAEVDRVALLADSGVSGSSPIGGFPNGEREGGRGLGIRVAMVYRRCRPI